VLNFRCCLFFGIKSFADIYFSSKLKHRRMQNRETNRLLLRMFTLDDLDDLARIFAKPNIVKYLGLENQPMSRDLEV
jgi:RimJ/RimL family protein N-acetyltransferase